MGVHAYAHGAVAKPKPCSRGLFLFVVVLVVLIGSYCAAAAADEKMNSNSRGSRRRRRRSRTAATAAEAVTPAAPLMVPITILKSAVDSGAVCMDGTPPAYNLDPGSGAGSKSWIVNLEGSAWCNSAKTCQLTKSSGRGSSDHMDKEIPFTGIMSSSPAVNPDFYNWNRVKIRYCDGGSFAGEAFDKVLLTGCSSGGLAVILHCDQLRAFFPSGTTVVKCISDGGLYLDAVDVSGRRSLRSHFGDIVVVQGIAQNLPPACTARFDATSIVLSLAPDRADPSGAWRACKSNRTACSASQMSFLQDFRDQMVASIKGFSGSRSTGLFISSCFAHCQSEQLAPGTPNQVAPPPFKTRGLRNPLVTGTSIGLK
ncbi:unnamed protein product [Miscanthus lutarioriparius]|uniref:Pectin acetylesterase n=1 Tax=Miscanthus lutarioriparius TaxID=422564 RepID=A0A811NWY0_9POAL|nr:unnamed protein product [Miscanthus lutarioriparius]